MNITQLTAGIVAGLFLAAPLRWALGLWWCWWLPFTGVCR